jgi:hypothetical protein
MFKQFAKSKTMIFAALLAALGVVQTSMDVFTAFLTPQAVGLLTMIVGVIVAILRVVTTTSIGDK